MATVIKAGNVASGAQVTSDATGILQFNTGSGAGTTAMTIGTDQSVTFAGAVSSSGNQTVTGNLTVDGNTTLGNANTDTILMTAAPSIGGAGLGMGFGFRNRIINGAMVIDQRNAGASVTPTDGQYSVDRWRCGLSQTSKFSVQQNSGSVTPPVGFTNYLGVVSLSAYTPTGNDVFMLQQKIEGFNVADLNYGTANAATVTISFWVRSSLTGSFGGSLINNAINRSYPFSYSISSANTWEQKTITVAGDTSGTWLTNSGSGLELRISLGGAGTYLGTANVWAASNLVQPTGSVNLVATNGATFYITGVQLEKGSTATSFDYRPYGTELQLCQRYYVRLINNINQELGGAWNYSATQISGMLYAPVPMRSTPAIISSSGTNYYIFYRNDTSDQFNSITIEFANASNTAVSYFNNTEISGTAGQAGLVRSFNALTSVALSSEL